MSNKNPLVSIIIPHYNERELLKECLNSFECSNYSPIELIVVDNGSNDGSKEMVRNEFDTVKLCEVPQNKGIGHVNNTGINAASGEYIVFDFNNDEIIEPGWISNLVDTLENSPEIGVVSGVRLQYNDRDIIDSAGIKYNIFGKQKSYSGVHINDLPKKEFRFVDFVEVPMFHRELIDEIGLLDEEYYFYSEDVDFCLRTKSAGYKIAVDTDSFTYHRRGATTSKGVQSRYYEERNRLRVFLKLFSKRKIPLTLLYWCIIRPIPKSILILFGSGVNDDDLSPLNTIIERIKHAWMLYVAIGWNIKHMHGGVRYRNGRSNG